MKRTLVEIIHLFSGLVGTALVAKLAAWSVPNVEETIWMVAWGAMLVVAFMAIRPLRLAWRADRQGTSGEEG